MALHRNTLPKEPNIEFDDCGLVKANPCTIKTQIARKHPLESSLRDTEKNVQALKNSVVLEAFGPAGPMVHMMELKAARSVGRLPFMQSSNSMCDALTGRDMEIDFVDIFSGPELQERMFPPHSIMERLPVQQAPNTFGALPAYYNIML